MNQETNPNPREDAIAAITAAFADVRRGRGVTLHHAQAIDEFALTKGVSRKMLRDAHAKDTDTHWTEVPASFIESQQNLPHLDAEGFAYYIPAYMVWTLANFDRSHSFTADATLYALCPDEGAKLDQHRKYQYSRLTAPQREAIRTFLRTVCALDPEGKHLDIQYAKKALDEYWSQQS